MTTEVNRLQISFICLLVQSFIHSIQLLFHSLYLILVFYCQPLTNTYEYMHFSVVPKLKFSDHVDSESQYKISTALHTTLIFNDLLALFL